MKCDDMLKLLNEYVDGEIDPAICEDFDRHLVGCDPCQVVIDTIRRTVTLYKGDAVHELPLEFRARLHATLRERWRQRQGERP